jgi:acetoacetate decarboxylase
VPHDIKIEQAWIGDGSLTLPVVDGEEVSDLAPVRCGKGIRASLAYVVDDLKTLKALTCPENERCSCLSAITLAAPSPSWS